MDDNMLQILAWADDTWLFASSTAQLDFMLGVCSCVAKRVASVELDFDRAFARVMPTGCRWPRARSSPEPLEHRTPLPPPPRCPSRLCAGGGHSRLVKRSAMDLVVGGAVGRLGTTDFSHGDAHGVPFKRGIRKLGLSHKVWGCVGGRSFSAMTYVWLCL